MQNNFAYASTAHFVVVPAIHAASSKASFHFRKNKRPESLRWILSFLLGRISRQALA
jgi:hypothetical protein